MSPPLLRSRRNPGIAVLSRLGRELRYSAEWLDDTVTLASSTVPAVTVTAAGSAHTKGAWSEIVASTSEDASLLAINTTAAVAILNADSRALLDIGIGGAGSETAIISNIVIGNKSSSSSGWLFPVFIPKGTRVAARIQHVTASTALTFRFRLGKTEPTSQRPASYTVTMGANTSTSSGVVVNYGGSTNTKGSWTEITASTSERFAGLHLCVDMNGDSTMGAATCLVDVATGGAGSETVIVSNVFYLQTSNEAIDHFGGGSPFMPVDVPAGARLSVRQQTSSGLNPDIGVALIGFPYRER